MPDLTARFPYNPLQPGGYSTIDTTALLAARVPQLNPQTVAVVGATTGGVPNSAMRFTEPGALKTVLRSGAAYDVARLAFVGGAQVVKVVRAGAPVQATKNLAGTSGTGVTLTAIDYGAWTNSIKVTVQANNNVTISYTDARGVTFTEPYAVGASATAADVADAINGRKLGFSKSAFVTAVAGAGTMPLATAAQSALASGSDGAALTGTDWTTALAALETEDVDLVVPATGDNTVHAQVMTHCDTMSTIAARHERTWVIGAVKAESVAQQVTRAAAVPNRRGQLVYCGVTMYDDLGVATAYDPFYLAGYIAGRHAGLDDPAQSLVHARLPHVIDVEKRLSTIAGGDVETLLAAGVSPVTPAPGGGFWLVDSLSTLTTDLDFRDFHKIRTADASARRLRTRLEDKFVGGKTLEGSAGEIRQEAVAELTDQLTVGLIRAYADVTVTQDPARPTAMLVVAPVSIPDTTKFILLTLALQPPSTVTQTTTAV